MPVPALPAPYFVVVEADLALGELEHVIDGPARPRRADYLLQWGVDRGVHQIVGQFVGPLGMAAEQHRVDPARAQRGTHQEVGPLVPARALGPLPATEPLPVRGGDGRRERRDRDLPRRAVGRPLVGCSLLRTASTYAWPRASRARRSFPALPYTASAVTQAAGTPASNARSSSSQASCGFV